MNRESSMVIKYSPTGIYLTHNSLVTIDGFTLFPPYTNK